MSSHSQRLVLIFKLYMSGLCFVLWINNVTLWPECFITWLRNHGLKSTLHSFISFRLIVPSLLSGYCALHYFPHIYRLRIQNISKNLQYYINVVNNELSERHNNHQKILGELFFFHSYNNYILTGKVKSL